jgi:NitT/TauT family transport system substrate-binding protein
MIARTLTALLIAAGTAALTTGTAHAQTYKLKYGIASISFTYAPFYVAQDAGFFKQEGVELDMVQVQGSSPAAAATIAGSMQFFIGIPQTAARPIAKGEKLAIFANVTKEYGSNIVVSKEWAEKHKLTAAMPIEQRLGAMKGLKIAAWTPGSSSDLFVRYIAAKQKWNADKELTILPIGGSAPMLAAMEQKRIDAFALSSPTADQAVQKFGALILYNGAKGEWAPLRGSPYITLIGNTDWLDKNQAAAAALYRGLQKAMTFMKQKPAETKAIVRKRLAAFDAAAFEAGYAASLPTVPTTPRLTVKDAEQVKEFLETLDGGKSLGIPAAKLIDERVAALAEKK